jgi:hypothetical protein
MKSRIRNSIFVPAAGVLLAAIVISGYPARAAAGDDAVKAAGETVEKRLQHLLDREEIRRLPLISISLPMKSLIFRETALPR